jgi:hypothetical protein
MAHCTPVGSTTKLCEISGLHGDEDSGRGLLGCDAVTMEDERPPETLVPHQYTVSQPSEDGGSKVLRNVGILPHQYTSQPTEDGGSKVLRNVGILPHHYRSSQPRRPRFEPLSKIVLILQHLHVDSRTKRTIT